MPEPPRTRPYEIERDRFGLMYSGPHLNVGEVTLVYEAGPVDTERERLLDLLEAALKFGTDHDLASYKAQGETIERIEAFLRERGRLPKGEQPNG